MDFDRLRGVMDPSISMSQSAHHLLMFLTVVENSEGVSWWPQPKIAQAMRCSTSTVARASKELEAVGILKTEPIMEGPNRKGTLYRVSSICIDPPFNLHTPSLQNECTLPPNCIDPPFNLHTPSLQNEEVITKENYQRELPKELPKEINPQTPKGDFSESDSLFLLEVESNEPKRKAWSPTQEQIEVAAIYRRRATTRWSDKELKSWRAIQPLDKDELELIKQFYSADIPKDNGYRRTTLATLLNNWQGEVDKARKYLASQAAKYDWSEITNEIPF